ncbi:ML domain containing protein [Lactarius tabidus]
MARLSALSALVFVALFSTSNADLLPASQQQQLVTNEGNPVHAIQGWSYKHCSSPTYPIQIDSISVFPDPPKPGENLTVTVKARAQEQVEEGAYADISVKLGFVQLLHEQFNLCDEARNANTSIQCPVKQGNFGVVHTVALPKEIPQVKVNVDVRGYTVNKEDLFCVKLNVDCVTRSFFGLPFGW